MKKQIFWIQCKFYVLRWDSQGDDWKFTEALREIIVNVEFQRGGQTLYYSTQIAAYVGLLTAVKPVCLPPIKYKNRINFCFTHWYCHVS